MNLEREENLKPSSFIDVGTNAKTIMSDFDNESDKKKVLFSRQKCYIAAVSHLQNNLPFNIKIIKYSQCLLMMICQAGGAYDGVRDTKITDF